MSGWKPSLLDDRDCMIAGGVCASRKRGGRVVTCLREAVLWCLALGPGAFVLWYGVRGILTQEFVPISRRGGFFKKALVGTDAVGWSWFVVAVGIWALGNGLRLKTGRTGWRIGGYLLAFVAVLIGFAVLGRLIGV